MSRFSPFRWLSPYKGAGGQRARSGGSNAFVLFRDSAGDRAISFHLKGALAGAKGNSYFLMFNRISSSGPRWGIRIYDKGCNIYLSTTLTVAVAMSALPATIAAGGLGGVLEARVYKSVNEAFTDATCADSSRFEGGR